MKSSANLQYRLEEENRLDQLRNADYRQQCTEINKPLSLNKRWDYNHGSLLQQIYFIN